LLAQPPGIDCDVGAAAVSARKAISGSRGASTVPAPAPGRYVGQVDGPMRQPVSMRYLGGGIRDLTIGGEVVAAWVPVVAGGAVADDPESGTEVRAMWSDDRRLDGWVRWRRPGRAPGEVRFVARHRFRDL
jgi:hypothetical protein